jgi:CRP-like cAMP-binding protein
MTRFTGDTGVLQRLPPFSWLSEAQLAWALPTVQHRTYPARAAIIRAGEKADGLYILLSGRVRVVYEDGEGHSFIANVIGPNDFFGEVGLIDGTDSSASVLAEVACDVLYIPRKVVVECLQENARAAMCMLKTVMTRLGETHRKLANLALTNVYDRVVRVVLENGHEDNGEWMVDIGSEQIAAMVGASREMVSRVMRELVQRGVARRHKRKLVVTNRDALTARRCRGVQTEPPAAA